jgi:hypothetical protein
MTRHAWLLALVLPIAAAPALAQAAQDKKTDKPQKVQAPRWPEMSKADQSKGRKWLKLLASKKDKTHQKASDELLALGVGMGDLMFKRMTDSPRNFNERIVFVLEQILKPSHSPLIALHASHKSTFARRYVFKKLAMFGQDGLTPVFKKARKDKDIEVSYYASLGLVKTARDFDALDQIFKRCEEEWGEIGDEVSRYLADSRSEKFCPWIYKKLASKEITEHIALLRVMRSIAPKESKSLVRRFLDSEHSILKKEAINTLRVIVDGEKPIPLKKLTVFQIIKMAKEWKVRI